MAAKKKRSPSVKKRRTQRRQKQTGPRCGLCGKTKNLTKTACCNNWICDDEHEYSTRGDDYWCDRCTAKLMREGR